MVNDAVEAETRPITKSEERWAFLILAVFLAPFMAGVIVGGYGFIVWMLQVVFGPPTG
ncbi:nitrate reductase [Rhodobacterales bacterium 56_14_T64]|nr:nitrate reductase [Rhodobacterales bacterium 56_14_T64]